uniref:Uncharacterized protein n=1 Tax=Streptomyces sp. NBC_01393 TaxID=2903851 RepID=A0AAU3I851_9ACTN
MDAVQITPDPAARAEALADMVSQLNSSGQHQAAANCLADAAAQARTLANTDQRAAALARAAHAAGDEAGHALLCEALSVGTWTQMLSVIPEVAPELLKTAVASLIGDT